MSFRYFWAVAAIGIFVASWPLPAHAAPVTLAELLDVGWDTKPQARADAERLYRQFVEQSPGDNQIVYAYALVKMQQRDYPEATKLLDEYLAIAKTDLAAWRAKAWISMLLKNRAASLTELDKLSQLLADEMQQVEKDPDIARRRAEQHQEYIGFLGRMIGFLEGPADGAVNAATLGAAKRKMLARLDETHKAAFEEGVAAVNDSFTVMAAAKDDAQVQEIAAAEKTKRDTLASLAKEAVDISERKEELKATADKIREEVQSENDAYAKADAPLASELSRLATQRAILDRDLSNITADIFAVRRRLERERDQFLREQLFREIGRLEVIATRIDNELIAVEARGSAVQAQRATLAAKHQQALAGYGSSAQRLDKEFKGMDNRLKRAEAERNQLKKPASGNTGKVIALNKQAVALSTYESFPLEQERQRLLDQAK